MFQKPFDLRDSRPIAGRSNPSAAVFDDLPVEPLPDMDAPAPSQACPKPLVDHRRGECLWPLGGAAAPGDWRTLFCCAPTEGGRGYCADHAARAFRTLPAVGPEPRR